MERVLPNSDVSGGTTQVHGPLRCAFGVADLPLEPHKTRAEYAAMKDADGPIHLQNSAQVRSVDYQLDRIDRGIALPTSLEYKVQVWTFGVAEGSQVPLTL
jgi:hypothetical protein